MKPMGSVNVDRVNSSSKEEQGHDATSRSTTSAKVCPHPSIERLRAGLICLAAHLQLHVDVLLRPQLHVLMGSHGYVRPPHPPPQ